jgi:hypothetical protein
METVIVRPAPRGDAAAARHTRTGAERHQHVPRDLASAWLLDAVSLHRELDDLFAGLAEPDGLVAFRDRAATVWRSSDPFVQRYLAHQVTHTPEEWDAGFEEAHLAEWYRVLMGAHLRPVCGLRSPAAVKDRLPDLGWLPADARRLAWGRELASMAERYAEAAAATALALVMPLGNKGWLGQDDVEEALAHLRGMDRRLFRDHQNLVPLVEELYAVLTSVAMVPDRVLLLPPS